MLQRKYELLRSHLDEVSRRLCAAADAMVLGRGGPSRVAKASGLSRTTIYAGFHELDPSPVPSVVPPKTAGRMRRSGGGRKRLAERDPDLLRDLDKLVDPITRGDPESPLRWTCKSTTKLTHALQAQGHHVSQHTVWTLLEQLGYRMQSNRKTHEGTEQPARDAQFLYIATQVQPLQEAGLPVIAVDTKKKERSGRFKHGGRAWQRKGHPEAGNVHDFADKELGKVVPYGVYDLTHTQGWVSVGINHDTAEFAVATIGRWWKRMGVRFYPQATAWLITADGGGSNGWRLRLWKLELQGFADESGLSLSICHFPPGTSKWNKIEHRLFSFISSNWRGEPLRDYQTMVNLIARTTTAKGLAVTCRLDRRKYPTGRKVSAEEMKQVNIRPNRFHGEWNYVIEPHQ